MLPRIPRPLRSGDTIGITAPSSGVPAELRPRLDVAVRLLQERGYAVRLGECLGTPSHVSAPAPERAAELMDMFTDPAVAAVVPPWGGETGIDLLRLLDFSLLAETEPTWYVGFSDISTTMLPLTLVSGWVTLHGSNLMDTPYDQASGLLHWLDVAGAAPGTVLTQRAATHRRSDGWDDWAADPSISAMTLSEPTRWRPLHGTDVDLEVSGVLVGGCLEVLGPFSGTRFGDVPAFAGHLRRESGSGLLVALEVAEHNPYDVARTLHGLRLAGWFDDAVGVLVGRTPAPDAAGWTQADAVADALGDLDVPVLLDVDFGHQQPAMPMLFGLPAIVTISGGRQQISQVVPG